MLNEPWQQREFHRMSTWLPPSLDDMDPAISGTEMLASALDTTAAAPVQSGSSPVCAVQYVAPC
jgi:hypothetical protein